MRVKVPDPRRAPRAKVSLPVRVQPFDSKYPEEICATLNVSRNGLYFVTSLRHYLECYFRGMKVRVMRNYQSNDPANRDESGEIVRVESLGEGKWGVAIHIPRGAQSEVHSGE